jgi:hypothetical protein
MGRHRRLVEGNFSEDGVGSVRYETVVRISEASCADAGLRIMPSAGWRLAMAHDASLMRPSRSSP